MPLQSVVPNMPNGRASFVACPDSSRPTAAAERPRGTPPQDALPNFPELLGPKIGVLATDRVTDALAGAREGLIAAQSHLVLPHLAIVTRGKGAMIELDDDRPVLTGLYDTQNDCRLLFRRPYSAVRFEVAAEGGEPTHLGLLSWQDNAFEERQTIDITIRRRRKRSPGEYNGARLTTLVEFHAEPLWEVHGIAWRGGLVRIAGLSLKP